MAEFVSSQIEELQGLEDVRCTNRFAIVKFKLPSQTKTYSFNTDHNEILFMFVLGKNYPLTPPRVHLKNGLLKPGLSDCRDYLTNIIEAD